MVSFVTVLFVSGARDTDMLGGVGLGIMIYNVFGLSLGIGMTAGLDTLVSQANGAGMYQWSGLHLQRAVVVSSMVSIFAWFMLLLSTSTLTMLGQGPGIASNASAYVRGAIPALWPMFVSSAVGTYLRAQRLPEPAMVVTWICNAFHIASCTIFVGQLQLGALGAGFAFSATQVLSCLLLVTFVQVGRPGITKKSWVPWDWKLATSNLRSFLEVSVPCALLIWSEWWCAEVMTIMAGYLGSSALAAHTAIIQVFSLAFMSAGGLSAAGAAIVGNAIGAGSAELAQRSSVAVLIAMAALAAVIDCAIWLGKKEIARTFAPDAEVQATAESLLDVLLIVVPLDALQTVIDGILRGLGKQFQAFKIKICCMWLLRFPMALVLCFWKGFGVAGIWWGSALGLGATMILLCHLVATLDWKAECELCLARQREARGPNSDVLSPASPGLYRGPQQMPVREAQGDDYIDVDCLEAQVRQISNCDRAADDQQACKTIL